MSILAILLMLLIRRGILWFCWSFSVLGSWHLSLLLLLLSLLLLILLPAPAPDIVGAHSVSTTDIVSTHTSVLHTACQQPTSFLRTLRGFRHWCWLFFVTWMSPALVPAPAPALVPAHGPAPALVPAPGPALAPASAPGLLLRLLLILVPGSYGIGR